MVLDTNILFSKSICCFFIFEQSAAEGDPRLKDGRNQDSTERSDT